MKNFSDQIRRAIRTSDMTQYAISKKSGLSRGGISRFMAGDRDMNLRTLDKLSPVLNVRIVVTPRKKAKKKGR